MILLLCRLSVAGYLYDPNGFRVEKTGGAGKVHYVQLLNGEVGYRKEFSGKEYSFVYLAGVHLAREDGVIGGRGKKYFYHNDYLGSALAVTDEHGKKVIERDFTPFGEKINLKEGINPYEDDGGFTGKDWDEDVEMYYYNARWYDAEIGRFISEDSVADDPTLYVYGANNPIINMDPTGHSSINWNKVGNALANKAINYIVSKIPGLSEALSVFNLFTGENSTEGEPSAKIPPPPADYTADQKAQYYLSNMGFDTGGVDGNMGVRSSSALIIFQYNEGIPITGEADSDTLSKLEECVNNGTTYQSIMKSDKIAHRKPGKPTFDKNDKNGELYTSQMAKIPGYNDNGKLSTVKIGRETAVNWAMMVEGAKEYNKTAAVKLNLNTFAASSPVSGYRDYQGQVGIRNRWATKIKNAYNSSDGSKYKTQVQETIAKGMSESDALAYVTRKYSANPGSSNHGWGKAIDFSFGDGSNEHNWVKANAYKYGFRPYAAEHWHWEL